MARPLADRAGEFAQSVTHAGRVAGQPPRRRARPCRPFPSRHSPFGRGRAAERAHKPSFDASLRRPTGVFTKFAPDHQPSWRLDRWLNPLYPTMLARGGSGVAPSKAVRRRARSPSSPWTAGLASGRSFQGLADGRYCKAHGAAIRALNDAGGFDDDDDEDDDDD